MPEGFTMNEILQGFVTESREHLATIERDLLNIEQAGADADPELVNKVFRAAHSVRGASGFLGLNKVKELAHKAETVLDMLRSQKIAPNAEVTNILLATFNKLRAMISAPGSSEEATIATEVDVLIALASSYLPPAEQAALTQKVPLQIAGQETPTMVERVDFDRTQRCGRCIYRIEYDLIRDIERRGQNLLKMFHELEANGEVLDCVVDYGAVGTLYDVAGNGIPVTLIYATAAEPAAISARIGTPQQIQLIWDSVDGNPSPDYWLANVTRDQNDAPAIETPVTAVTPIPEPPVLSTPADVIFQSPLSSPAKVSRPAPAETGLKAGPSASKSPSDVALLNNVSVLDTLMNLAQRLVLSSKEFQTAIAQKSYGMITSAGQHLSQLTSEIQNVLTLDHAELAAETGLTTSSADPGDPKRDGLRNTEESGSEGRSLLLFQDFPGWGKH